MKYNINNLFFAKCRNSIMDMINVIDDNGIVMYPHPDYLDYYTILLLKNNKYINIFNKKVRYKHVSEIEDSDEYYYEDLILEIHSLLDYIDTDRKKVSDKECDLIESTIEKTKALKRELGYKKK